MDQLDHQREIVLEDLRGLVGGDVRCDDLYLQLYASDGGIHEIKPLGVVHPRSAADVAACVEYAAEKRIPIHARGAGTGLAGGCVGPGLIVDTSRFLRHVISTGGDWVRVQPGIVHERLNHHLRSMGQFFGPDPLSSEVTTIGGMIAVDAAGSRWLRYGSTRRHVRSLQVVLGDGRRMELGQEPLVRQPGEDAASRKRQLVERVAAILTANTRLIERHRPKSPVGRCGYHLAGVLHDDHVDLARLLVGSEGTLGLITEATLGTAAVPEARGVVLLLFDSLDKATRAALEITALGPTACDLMDRRHLSIAREMEVRFDLLIPPRTEAVVLVEQSGEDMAAMRDWVHAMVDDVRHKRQLAFGAHVAFDPHEIDLFWSLPLTVPSSLYAMKGPIRPIPVVEDIAVPPEILPEFLVRIQNTLKHHQITASLFCHVGQGSLHLRPLLNVDDPADGLRMHRLAEELYQRVFEAGGTIGSSSALGLSRSGLLRQHLAELDGVLRQIKQAFDPPNILNPGKVLSDDPLQTTRYLRPPIRVAAADPAAEATPPLRDLVELQLNWEPRQVMAATEACNRCGDCRTQAATARMCPIHRFAPAEEASPRAKANVIRGTLTGQTELSQLTSDEFKAIADLCVHCHMCRLECPAAVDIPRLMREAKGAYVRANGLPASDWLMTHLDLVGSLAGLVAPVANWALGNRQMRWLIEKTLGVAQGRKLPRFASRNFLRWAARRRLTRPVRGTQRKVVYFVDIYANYFDPQLGAALVAVLEHNGVGVYVHPEQRQAGMPSVACGSLDHARALARANIKVLAEAVRQGYDIVATEPSAALCLVREYPQLVDDEDARLVAEHTSEACTYLWRMHTSGKLHLDLKPVHQVLGYHLPCHLKALEVGSPGENLLRLIPGLRVKRLEEGCSGMAGTYGIRRRNYRSSLRAGWGLISRLRHPDIQAGTTECSTCKMQMEQGTTKPTVHPVKLLALAYGLKTDFGDMPAVEERAGR